MKHKKELILWFLVLLYILLKHFIPGGNYIIYPINLIVTFLHEFGHSFFAFITWWSIKSIQINSDWSGYAVTSWWIRSIVLMWWYIWSAIFWNILLYIWYKKEKYSQKIIYLLSALMLITWIFLFNSLFSSIILFIISALLFFIAKKTKFDSVILQFLWVASILFIIEDFNVWPSSDLSKFSDIFIIVPTFLWMYIWLIIVIIITFYNLKFILKKQIK